MHRVSVLSPRPSTGTSLHTCTLRRKGKTSFFPVTLCASSSCIIFLCATHTYTHTLMHTHILTSSPPSEIRRERRWEDVQRRLFPLYSPFPSLTHVHSHAHTLSLAHTHTSFYLAVIVAAWRLLSLKIIPSASPTHFKSKTQKRWHKNVTSTAKWLCHKCMFPFAACLNPGTVLLGTKRGLKDAEPEALF